ncbi:peptidase M13, partial [Citrobacter sp. TBCS-11]
FKPQFAASVRHDPGVLAKVETLQSFKDFQENLSQLILHSQTSVPFSFSVEPDMKDAIHYSLGFSGPGLLLPDTSYY